MRNLNSNIKNAILKNKIPSYCFEISLPDTKQIFLTSSSKLVQYGNIKYYPYSGLQIIKTVFTDSIKDYIVIEGIFEILGICKNIDMLNAKVKIVANFSKIFFHLVTYYVTKYTKNDLTFTLKLESDSIKYNQTIVNYYSKTCRAMLGDKKCQVDLKNYSIKVVIIELRENTIIISPTGSPEGYFNDGTIFTDSGIFLMKIITHSNEMIQVNQEDIWKLRLYDQILIVTECDKKFITCCNKFNNAVNFRGEPFIPSQKFLNLS